MSIVPLSLQMQKPCHWASARHTSQITCSRDPALLSYPLSSHLTSLTGRSAPDKPHNTSAQPQLRLKAHDLQAVWRGLGALAERFLC